MIVADTNLVAYLFIEGDQTSTARGVWVRDSEWMLPTIWRSEFLNVLTTAVRARVLTLEQAHDTWRVALAIFADSEVETSGDDVLRVAADRVLSADDAQFVAAAQELGVRLVTSDKRMLKACPDLAIAPDRFAA